MARFRDGRAVVGARCPWCREFMAPCTHYSGRWHVMREVRDFHSQACRARWEQRAAARRRPWREGRPEGIDRDHLRWAVITQTDGNEAREQLPDAMGVPMAAAFAFASRSTIYAKIHDGTIEARRVRGPSGWKWELDTDSLLAWMVATGRRDPEA